MNVHFQVRTKFLKTVVLLWHLWRYTVILKCGMILIRLILIDFFLKTTLQEIPLLMSLSRQDLETVLVRSKAQ